MDAIDVVARDFGLTRNGAVNLLVRIALPIARFHAHLLKGNIRKTLSEMESGSKSLRIPGLEKPRRKGA